jgi:hypothetical protein
MTTPKSEKEKRREEIVDIGLKIIHFWLDHPEKSLKWVLQNLVYEQ